MEQDEDDDDDRGALEPWAWVFMIGGTCLWALILIALGIAAYRYWA